MAAGRSTVTTEPAFVNANCTAAETAKACTTEVDDPHNLGMSKVKAIRLPHPNAWPKIFTSSTATRWATTRPKRSPTPAPTAPSISTHTKPLETFEVGAVVVATGWKPYPLESLDDLGGDLDDVIANVQMERLASPAGPTAARSCAPPTAKPRPRLPLFSAPVLATSTTSTTVRASAAWHRSSKHTYVKDQLPDAEVTMYYIDRRAPGRNEDVLVKTAAIEGVTLMKGKVGRIEQNGGGLKLHVEDVENEKIIEAEADLVVLATGMVPNAADDDSAVFTRKDDDGFVLDDLEAGVTVAGVARRPEDVAASVRDATGAAARALVMAGRRA